MEGIQGKLEGVDELLKILNTIGNDRVVQSILKKANREAVKPLQRQMKGLPFPGSIPSNMAIRATKVGGYRNPNAILVGPTSKTYWVRFIEKGTKDRYTNTNPSLYRGRIKGINKLVPLINREAPRILKYVQKQYGEDLVKVTEKYAKRINRNK